MQEVSIDTDIIGFILLTMYSVVRLNVLISLLAITY